MRLDRRILLKVKLFLPISSAIAQLSHYCKPKFSIKMIFKLLLLLKNISLSYLIIQIIHIINNK